MHKLVQSLFIIFMIVFPFLSFADQFSKNNNYDFRNTKWGMSQAEVLESEVIVPKESSSESLIFESDLGNRNALIEYFFSKGKLIRAMYFINQGYYDPAKHFQDYNLFDKLLKKKYGDPKTFKKLWSGTESIRKEFDEPLAVYFGYLGLKTDWKTGKTSISHVLNKSGSAATGGGIHHSITFYYNNTN